jgi:flagellar hook-associated protein 1 FlgK
MVAALNTAFTGNATFALDASGQLSMTPAAAYAGYDLEVASDTTARGTTGQSFSQLFGLGAGQALAQAMNFSMRSDVSASPARLALAQSSLTSASVLGDTVASQGDNRNALALQGLGDAQITFTAAGGIQARTVTLADYAAGLFQDVGTRAGNASDRKDSETARLTEAQTRAGAVEGVNLDEELANMMTLQQAYNAGARLIKTAQDLFDQLLQVV